ncbi:an1-like zinc finger [Holotrichia oblita]|uniref:An1-like zinc finger n=1 Tax=Holotrichia oblita TaxID=644536 RepID=A0ACB9THE9_HOLOL|nr:an1-like zinc finger [Holotrichia oblita]
MASTSKRFLTDAELESILEDPAFYESEQESDADSDTFLQSDNESTSEASIQSSTSSESDDEDNVKHSSTPSDTEPTRKSRSYVCPRQTDEKTKMVCEKCKTHICLSHRYSVCQNCL